MSKKSFQALVVAAPQGSQSVSFIITGSVLLVDDIRDAIGSQAAEDSLGAPPGNGLWMWEGDLITTKSWEDDYDVDYRGEYRRLTDEEVQKVLKGEAIIAWEPPNEDEEEPLEENDIFALKP
jgi:hypothetical protein